MGKLLCPCWISGICTETKTRCLKTISSIVDRNYSLWMFVTNNFGTGIAINTLDYLQSTNPDEIKYIDELQNATIQMRKPANEAIQWWKLKLYYVFDRLDIKQKEDGYAYIHNMINELNMLSGIIPKRGLETETYYKQPRKKVKLCDEAM